MNDKKVFIVSFIIMIIAIICMGVNRFISPLSDNVIRVTGIIMLINIPILAYSTVRLKNHTKITK